MKNSNFKIFTLTALILILIVCLPGCKGPGGETQQLTSTAAITTTAPAAPVSTSTKPVVTTQTSPTQSIEPTNTTTIAVKPADTPEKTVTETPKTSTEPAPTTVETVSPTPSDTPTPSPTATPSPSPTAKTTTGGSSGGGGGGGYVTTYYTSADLFGVKQLIETTSDGRLKKEFTASSEDGIVTLKIAAGTYVRNSAGRRLQILTATNADDAVKAEGTEIVCPVYSFGEAGATFDPAIIFTYKYNLDEYPEVAEDTLYFAGYEGETETWTKIDEGVVLNKTQDTITASISHFSTYGIIGNTTRTITDMYGTELVIPAVINRVLSGGPVETQLIYMLAPDKLCAINGKEGDSFWNDSPDGTGAYIPDKYKDLPNIGSWSSSPQSFEAAIAADPDIVLEGKTKNLANYRTQFGSIPVVGVNAGASLCWDFEDEITFVGNLLGVPEKAAELIAYYQEAMGYVNGVVGGFRGESITDEDGPEKIRVYYAEGTDGLSTDAKGSWHTNLLWFCGGANVADVDVQNTSQMVIVSMEDIIGWDETDPIDMIIMGRSTLTTTYSDIMNSELWQILDCVKNGKVYIRPENPTSWFDGPPGYGQIIGMYWMVNVLYPDLTQDLNLSEKIKEFYTKFYHYDLSDAEAANLLNQPGN